MPSGYKFLPPSAAKNEGRNITNRMKAIKVKTKAEKVKTTTEGTKLSRKSHKYREPLKADVHEIVGCKMIVLFVLFELLLSPPGLPHSPASESLEEQPVK